MAEIKPDWKSLEHPQGFFYFFKPEPEKIKFIAKELMEKKFNLSDEFRTYPSIYNILGYYLGGYSYSFFYEIRKKDTMQALLGFTSVIPDFKCDVFFKLFDEALWGKDFVRQLRQVLKLVMDEFKLKRISTSTPDERVQKMARLSGFKDENTKEKDFMWDGELYPNFILSIVEE